jgi:hypothetical protein
MAKPTLFIGSSAESLPFAYAAQANLEDYAQVVVWSQGVFSMSKFILESLLDMLDESQFGLFIFAPVDVLTMRGKDSHAVRDNVIFELGLFIGRLGRDRSFIIMPKAVEDVHLPSDLLGINVGTFVPPEKPKFLQSSLGPACFAVQSAIQGLAESNQLGLQRANDSLPAIVPEPMRTHLVNLAKGRTASYEGRGSLRSELRQLRTTGLIEMMPGRNVGDIKTGMLVDLADYVRLTDSGLQWLRSMREL